ELDAHVADSVVPGPLQGPGGVSDGGIQGAAAVAGDRFGLCGGEGLAFPVLAQPVETGGAADPGWPVELYGHEDRPFLMRSANASASAATASGVSRVAYSSICCCTAESSPPHASASASSI